MEEVRKKSPSLNDSQRKMLEKPEVLPTAIQIAKSAVSRSDIIFPNQNSFNDYVPCTIQNLQALLENRGIKARYNLIKKRTDIYIPDHKGTVDNASEVAVTKIVSLAASYSMPTGHVPKFLDAIADENAYNPVADWIRSKPWDGTDRLPDLCNTIQVRDGYPLRLRDLLLRKWMLSVAAAALMPTGFKTRGVLTLQGDQGIGKTSWLKALIDDQILRDEVIKLDHHLDPGSKDSVMIATAHLMVEIGEIGSTFRKDIDKLKSFLTSDFDKIRRPYARQETDQPRRTVFMATVNEHSFLIDPTGHSRWWTIQVQSIDFVHGIDMQQLFAQLAVSFDDGQEWWLDAQEEQVLADQNKSHMMASVVDDILSSEIDHDVLEDDRLLCTAYTASELLIVVGIERPTNAQARECGSILRKLFGDPKRVRGSDKWRVPLISDEKPVPVAERVKPKPHFN